MSQLGKRSKPWTGAELKTLREIKASNMTVKQCMHMLPDRTIIAIKQAMYRLPGNRKQRGRTGWVFTAMQRVLTETPWLTNAQLAEAIGCTRNAICDVLRGDYGKEIHVSGWIRAGTMWAAQYSLGSLPDAEKPEPRTREESYRAQLTARRARRRAKNPFAVTMAQLCGSRPTLQEAPGRIYRQPMSVTEDEGEMA